VVGTNANNDLIAVENTDNTKYSSIAFFDSTGAGQTAIGWGNSSVVDTAARNRWNFFHGATDVYFNRSASASLFIQGSSGFIGLATTGPTAQLTVAAPLVTSGVQTSVLVTAPANTGMTASTDIADVNFNLARSVQFATGAKTLQRAALFQAPTYTAVGSTTISDAALIATSGAPIASTNVTITRSHDLYLGGGAIGAPATMLFTSGQANATDAAFRFTATNAYNAITKPLIEVVTGGNVAFRLISDNAPDIYLDGYNIASSGTFLSGFILQANKVRLHSTATLSGQSDLGSDLGGSADRWSTLWARSHAGVEQTIAAAASINLAATSGETIRVTLSATAVTTITSTAGNSGQVMRVEIIQDATGSRTFGGFNSSFLIAGGAFTVTATANKRDVLTFLWDNTNSKWVEMARSQNL
jgi:hypothetical protein